MLAVSVARPWRLVDLEYAFLPAARAVLHGNSPYAGAYAQLREIGSAYIYPPPIAFLAVPFTALPKPAAAALFTAIMVAATVAGCGSWVCVTGAAMRLRWWPTRCWPPSLRAPSAYDRADHRRRVAVAQLAVGGRLPGGTGDRCQALLLAVAVWLVRTGRLRAAAVAAVAGVSVIAGRGP